MASLNSLYTIGSGISRLKVFYSVSVVDIISYSLNIGFQLGPQSAYCNETHGQGKKKNERKAEYKYKYMVLDSTTSSLISMISMAFLDFHKLACHKKPVGNITI